MTKARKALAALAIAWGLLAAHADAATAAANYQGLWWNAPAGSETGWGINFAHQGDTIFGSWFTFDVDGAPLWMVVAANKTGPNVYSGNVVRGTGPAFSSVPFDTSKVAGTTVGTATFTFVDDSNASFAWTIGGISRTKSITRQVFASPVPTCTWGALADLAQATNFQDLWWAAPAGSESGWGINLTHQGDTIFGSWFTFGSNGKPLWLVVAAAKSATKVYSGRLFTGTGPAYNAAYDAAKLVPTDVGSATFTFADGNSAKFDYTVNGISQSKTITRQIFGGKGTACATEAPSAPGAFTASLASTTPVPPLSAATISVGGATAAASFEIEYNLGSGLVVVAPADVVAPGTLRAMVPAGVFSAVSFFEAGTATLRVKRTRVAGKSLAVDYSNTFALSIGALPTTTLPPGTLAKLLTNVTNKLRQGTPNALVSQATLDALTASRLPAAAIDALSPASKALADRMALAYLQNTLGVSVPGAQPGLAKAHVAAFGDDPFVTDIAQAIAEKARASGQKLIDVGGNLMLGAAVVAVVVESPVLLAAAATTAAAGAVASYVGLSFGTAEGLVMDNVSQIAGTPESGWKSSVASLRFFAENTVKNIVGDMQDSAVVDKLGVPEAVWNALKLATQTSPTDAMLTAVSDRVEAYVNAQGTPEQKALLEGDSHARDIARLTGPQGTGDDAVLKSAIGIMQGILAAMPGNTDPVFLGKVSHWLDCVMPALSPLLAFPPDTPANDPTYVAAIDALVPLFVSCTGSVYGGLASVPTPPPVEFAAPGGGTMTEQAGACWKSGCMIDQTTCGQGGCTTTSAPAACKDGLCELTAPPVCPAGLRNGGPTTGCVP